MIMGEEKALRFAQKYPAFLLLRITSSTKTLATRQYSDTKPTLLLLAVKALETIKKKDQAQIFMDVQTRC
jgi:hypothetical protein